MTTALIQLSYEIITTLGLAQRWIIHPAYLRPVGTQHWYKKQSKTKTKKQEPLGTRGKAKLLRVLSSFNSQHPHGVSQASVAPVPDYLTPFSDLMQWVCT